jgi:hypothetical protein
MTLRRALFIATAFLAVLLNTAPRVAAGPGEKALPTVSSGLDDQEFWRLVSSFSERPGTFQSDNLLSNERSLQHVIPALTRTVKENGVYLGVGPEQNFTYILALKPRLAFIVDIRQGNLDLHLIYKALFEMSADRAEFVSRLFSRKRPEGLTANATSASLFSAFAPVEPDESFFIQNQRAIVNLLVKQHGFVLSSGDMLRLQHIYRSFYRYGPAIQYSTTRNAGRRITAEPTYAELMGATDADGQARGFLASEAGFAYVKALELDNRIVPLIGNFAGPKAIRAVGQYLKEHGAIVSAFYLSNVEEYLRQDDALATFCANAAALPIDETSTFIRSVRVGEPAPTFDLHSRLGQMAAEIKNCE